ncbi:MAG: hypothetical protein K0Q95_2803 [Bacteroidota bacterium]|jgi:hypothetical protein|nr:hypothetical protein [Bacteroidota bacterium]
MKKFRIIAAFACSIILIGYSSCLVVVPHGSNSGSKKGWNKNSNNPHHPNTTNPGHTKQKNKNK